MKKIILWIFIIIILVMGIVYSLSVAKNKDNTIQDLKNQLYDMTEKFNLLNDEKKSLENKVSELEDSLEEQKKKSETVTSRSSGSSRTSKNTTSNSTSWSDLELLARIINAEAGGCTDEHQLLVGNVVLNRVADSRFPDSIYEVIYQKGQYSPTWNGAINKTPTQQAYKNAQRLLDGERFCPSNVVFQANFKQGKGVYKTISTSYSTTYFCY